MKKEIVLNLLVEMAVESAFIKKDFGKDMIERNFFVIF